MEDELKCEFCGERQSDNEAMIRHLDWHNRNDVEHESLAYHPELVTWDRVLTVLKALITSANSIDRGDTVVRREAILAAERLYRDATGVFLNVG
jgi:predicted metal-dependent hydrolase